MLYDNRTIGRVSVWLAIRETVHDMAKPRHKADLDLQYLSPHLRRDMGLEEGVSRLLPGTLDRK